MSRPHTVPVAVLAARGGERHDHMAVVIAYRRRHRDYEPLTSEELREDRSPGYTLIPMPDRVPTRTYIEMRLRAWVRRAARQYVEHEFVYLCLVALFTFAAVYGLVAAL